MDAIRRQAQRAPDSAAIQLELIAAILERPVREKILTHVGLDPQPPPRAAAREPAPQLAG